MLLLFDIGNTNVNIGISDNTKILKSFRLNSEVEKTADEYYLALKSLLDNSDITGVAIASVVPRITEKIIALSKRFLNLMPLIVGPGVKTGINIKTDNPKEVGADLICGAAGLKQQGSTLIVDLGTAIKYIYVKKKMIKGVIITPGVDISIKALVGNTALLPDVDITVPKTVLGTNTTHCMQSGITYGVAAQVDGLIERIKTEVGEDFAVVLTGGLSPIIAPLCRHELTEDINIVLKGLFNIYNKNER